MSLFAYHCLYTVAMETRITNKQKNKKGILNSSENNTILWRCESKFSLF